MKTTKSIPGFHSSYIPWTLIQEGDLVNWPVGVKSIRPSELPKSDQLKIYENLHSIYFSYDSLKRISTQERRNDHLWNRGVIELSRVLNEKLQEQSQGASINVPWDTLNPGDIIGWPNSVEISRPMFIEPTDLEKILKNVHNMEFTPSFITNIIRSSSAHQHPLGII